MCGSLCFFPYFTKKKPLKASSFVLRLSRGYSVLPPANNNNNNEKKKKKKKKKIYIHIYIERERESDGFLFE